MTLTELSEQIQSDLIIHFSDYVSTEAMDRMCQVVVDNFKEFTKEVTV